MIWRLLKNTVFGLCVNACAMRVIVSYTGLKTVWQSCVKHNDTFVPWRICVTIYLFLFLFFGQSLLPLFHFPKTVFFLLFWKVLFCLSIYLICLFVDLYFLFFYSYLILLNFIFIFFSAFGPAFFASIFFIFLIFDSINFFRNSQSSQEALADLTWLEPKGLKTAAALSLHSSSPFPPPRRFWVFFSNRPLLSPVCNLVFYLIVCFFPFNGDYHSTVVETS